MQISNEKTIFTNCQKSRPLTVISQAFKNSEFIAPTTKFFATTFSNGSVYSDIAGRFNILNPGRWNHFIDGINLTGIFDKYKNLWRQYPSIKWH